MPARHHLPRQCLGQEIRSLQVDAHQFFEALLAGFEDVGAHTRRSSGVVDEGVDGAVAVSDRFGQARAIGGAADVGPEVVGTAGERGQHRGHVFRAAHAAQRQVPAVAGERSRDAEPDAPRAAGDECRAHGRLRGHDAGPKNVRYGCASAMRRTSSAASRR